MGRSGTHTRRVVSPAACDTPMVLCRCREVPRSRMSVSITPLYRPGIDHAACRMFLRARASSEPRGGDRAGWGPADPRRARCCVGHVGVNEFEETGRATREQRRGVGRPKRTLGRVESGEGGAVEPSRSEAGARGGLCPSGTRGVGTTPPGGA